eukprot:jgi/Hompol1/870/HPOL_004033-RA
MGTSPTDWQLVESTLERYPGRIVPAFDRSTGKLYPMDQQLHVFVAQMALAIELNRPVSVHAVQVHGKILDYFREMDRMCGQLKAKWKRHRMESARSAVMPKMPCPPAIMMHSFTASPDIGRSLIKLPHIGPRFFFSFSSVVNARSSKFDERVLAVPDDRILLESDIHDATAVDQQMANICQAVATIRGWTLAETVERSTRNAEAFLRSAASIAVRR